MPICRALIKYGYSEFSLEILEYCAPEVRFEREYHYIKVLNPEYNIVRESNAMPSRIGHILKSVHSRLVLKLVLREG